MNITGAIIEHFSLPFLFLATILSIVSLLSEHYKVTKLADLLRNISIGSLGVMLTIFRCIVYQGSNNSYCRRDSDTSS